LKATNATEVNLRFPGQYFDVESNLSYNYFRSYNGSQGKYSQPDPIGLDGGLNRTSYVEASPLLRIDSKGLQSFPDDRPAGPLIIPHPSAAAQRELARMLTELFCDSNCIELQIKIDGLKGEVRKRYVAATADKNNVFRNNLFGKFGWFTHIVTYKGYQTGLRRALDDAKALGCPPDAEGERLANLDYPDSPAR
jgi:RHS repeat-associated protein